jgi:hypothetical protein
MRFGLIRNRGQSGERIASVIRYGFVVQGASLTELVERARARAELFLGESGRVDWLDMSVCDSLVKGDGTVTSYEAQCTAEGSVRLLKGEADG